MMKKTIMALALATTAVSGSALAWNANGTGGSLELGGKLIPKASVTVWEVLVSQDVTGLDANIKPGATTIDIPVTKPITVLGIRTLSNEPIQGATGISPQINYSNAIDTTKFNASLAPLTLEMKDEQQNKIGMLSTNIYAAALISTVNAGSTSLQASMYAPNTGSGFFGGLPTIKTQTESNPIARLNVINAQFSENFNTQNTELANSVIESRFDSTSTKFSAYYGAGIESGQTMKLTLNTPAGSDSIKWKASMPITVSYQ